MGVDAHVLVDVAFPVAPAPLPQPGPGMSAFGDYGSDKKDGGDSSGYYRDIMQLPGTDTEETEGKRMGRKVLKALGLSKSGDDGDEGGEEEDANADPEEHVQIWRFGRRLNVGGDGLQVVEYGEGRWASDWVIHDMNRHLHDQIRQPLFMWGDGNLEEEEQGEEQEDEEGMEHQHLDQQHGLPLPAARSTDPFTAHEIKGATVPVEILLSACKGGRDSA
jgi:hypothetical protein